ncbi:MAG TPA: hypothetical protein VE404_00310 [Verrucomicrobiae bacterium]|nr:hypothetical protein [Verrucomicrobiae bacterium]
MRTAGEKTFGNPDGRLDEAFRSLAAEEAGESLTASSRAHILREARKAAPGASSWLFLPARVPAFATALGAALILAFAYFTSSVPVQSLSAPTATDRPAAADLRVSQSGDGVVLEWSDGTKDAYVVRQATSAKSVYSAPGVEVKGHRYVDRSPSDAAVTYYLVE